MVKNEVLSARDAGLLEPAGEGWIQVDVEQSAGGSRLARATVKAEVAGTLISAGEGIPGTAQASSRVLESQRSRCHDVQPALPTVVAYSPHEIRRRS